MQTIILKLNPARLANPNLDLCYLVPERIQEQSHNIVQDNGYDYLPDSSLGLWLQTESAATSYPMIITLLQEEQFLENDLSASSEIYISEKDCDDIENCTLVFPI